MATITVRAPARDTTETFATGSVFRHAARAGMIGGVAVVYMALTGIIQRFRAKAIITDVLDLGYALVLLVLLLTGYMATRVRNADGERLVLPAAWRLAAGATTGAIAGAFLGVFTLIFSAVNLREIFINVSPELLEETLSFGQSAMVGALLLVAIGALSAALGAALSFLRPEDRRIVLAGLIAVLFVGLLEQLLRVMLDTLLLETNWLYVGGGLTITGAVAIFVIAAAIAFVFTRRERLLSGIIAGEGDQDRARWLDGVGLWLGIGAAVFGFVLAGIGLVAEEPLDVIPVSLLAVALVVALLALILGGARSRRVGTTGQRRGKGMIGYVAAAAALAAIVPLVTGEFLSNTLVTVMIYVLLGLGLNIVVGLAGLLDLGYVAFFAIGAYGLGLLTSPLSGLVTEGVGEFGAGSQAQGIPVTNFWVALPFVVIAALIFGLLLGAPVVRLRGDYLAIVTLGFGEIIRVIVQSDWAGPLLGGSQGLKLIPAPPPETATFSFRDPQRLYYLILIASLLMTYVTWRLQYSRVGRAWAAMREDESVAEGMGISVIRYKLLAFAIGAAVASVGGIFFAAQLSVTTPESFQLLVSITVLAVIILGGMGSVVGVIVGAAVLLGLPELLREFAEYRLLFYGAALVAIMLLRPEGLVPNIRRRRELHEREIEEQQFAERVGASGTEPELTGAPTPTVTPQSQEQIE